MAPVPNLLVRYTRRPSGGGGHSGLGAGLGGGIVAAILFLMFVIFVGVFIYQWRKESARRTQTGQPIRWGRVFKIAFLSGITVGIVSCCCAEMCFGGDDAPVQQQGGGVPMQDYGQGGGYMPPPQQYQSPGMDWTPVNNAATTPVQ